MTTDLKNISVPRLPNLKSVLTYPDLKNVKFYEELEHVKDKHNFKFKNYFKEISSKIKWLYIINRKF